MAQKPMMRADMHARALRASKNSIELRCGLPHSGGGVEDLGFCPFVLAFGPILPACVTHKVSGTEDLAERRRVHSVDHAGLEVEKHRT